MLINWWLESIKWKKAIDKLEHLTISTSVKSVLAGLTIGILTPNRVGNFIGRVLYLKEENRGKGTLISMYTNLAQLIATVVFGFIALTFLLQANTSFNSIDLPIGLIQVSSIVIGLLLMILYLNPLLVSKPLNWLIKAKKIQDILNVLPQIGLKTRLKVLLLSLLRYLIFTSQFTILLISLNEDFSILLIWMGVSVTYLITTIIPSPALGKFGIRESVSIFVFTLVGLTEDTILLSSLLLWVINLMIPSLMGGIFLLKQKLISE